MVRFNIFVYMISIVMVDFNSLSGALVVNSASRYTDITPVRRIVMVGTG